MGSDEHDITPSADEDRSQQWYDDVVEVMGGLEADVEEEARRAAEKARRPRLLTWLFTVSAVAFTGVVAWNLAPMFQEVEPLPAPEQETSLGAMAYMLVLRIEAYRDARGEIPPSLDALGLPLTGFEYHPLGEEYEIVARAGEARIIYRSGDPPSILLETGEASDPAEGAAQT